MATTISSLILLLVIGSIVYFTVDSKTENQQQAYIEQQREIAAKLKAAGLHMEAAERYGYYLSQTKLSADRKANISFSLGNLYLDQGAYEKALRWYYEAETIGPSSELAGELSTKIVHALERLGRIHAAKAALASRVNIENTDPQRSVSDQLVAKIGERSIYRSDIQKALDELPPEIAQHFSTPDRQVEFLKKYVADALIFQKAQKLEYDKDATLRNRLNAFFKQLVVSLFVEKEILGKIQVNPADLQTYYTAHQEKYNQPSTFKLRLIKLATQKSAEQFKREVKNKEIFSKIAKQHSLDKTTKAEGGVIPRWLSLGEKIAGETLSSQAWDKIDSMSTGRVVGPLPAGSYMFLLWIDEKRKGRHRSFDEVKASVEQDYRFMKTQTAYQELIQQELSREDIQIFPEKMLATESH